ncbi:hypothetical protein EJB05_31714, partial [Eragrostis curvula]
MLRPALHIFAFVLQLSVAAPLEPPPPHHHHQQTCSPKTCGDLNISYPFWLEEPGRPVCGPPSFGLKCNRSGAFLKSSVFESYRVVSIFMENNTIHVVDENLHLATGCPPPCFNISLIGEMAAFAISKTNAGMLFLSRCEEPVHEVPTGFRRMPCDNSSFVRLGGEGQFSVDGAVPPGCLLSVVPTRQALDGNGSDFIASMKNGFLLEWTTTVISGDCSKCMANGGKCIQRVNGLGFSCSCPDGIQYPLTCGRKGTRRRIILIGRRDERNIEALISSHGSLAPKRYKYSEVTKITSSFNNKLGEGGYGVVYKGMLHDGRLVAVKLLHDSKANGEEFVNEGSKRALIYEYMPNGSLDKYIYSENPKAILGWERLYAIAVGIARGEDSTCNLSAESISNNSSKTQAYSEVIKVNEMSLVNSTETYFSSSCTHCFPIPILFTIRSSLNPNELIYTSTDYSYGAVQLKAGEQSQVNY